MSVLRRIRHFRQSLRNPWAGVALALALGGLAGWFALAFFLSDDADPVQTTGYYYDLATKKLFVAPLAQLAPIRAPSDGPDAKEFQGVEALVYACGSCASDARFIGFLRQFTADAKEAMLAGQDTGNVGMLVRAEAQGEWVEINSPQGLEIIAIPGRRCAERGSRVQACLAPKP